MFPASVSYTTVYGGYTWAYKTNIILSGGYLDKTNYATKAKALTACSKASKCKGVIYLPSTKKFRCVTGTKEKTLSGGKYWKKKGSSKTYGGRVWTVYSGYYITGAKSSTKKYTG